MDAHMAFRKEIHMGGNDHLVVARDGLGRPQLFRHDENELGDDLDASLDLDEQMPFRDYPGIPSPVDRIRDGAIVARLKEAGNGRLPKKGAILNYNQSKALFEETYDHMAAESPLMNAERWLAGFVERNGITYTDHDGRKYRMKNGLRYPVKIKAAAKKKAPTPPPPDNDTQSVLDWADDDFLVV